MTWCLFVELPPAMAPPIPWPWRGRHDLLHQRDRHDFRLRAAILEHTLRANCPLPMGLSLQQTPTDSISLHRPQPSSASASNGLSCHRPRSSMHLRRQNIFRLRRLPPLWSSGPLPGPLPRARYSAPDEACARLVASRAVTQGIAWSAT